MKSSSIREYLSHYGKIRSLRGSNIRSTFKRVNAAFDEFEQEAVDVAMQELSLDPDNLACIYCGKPADSWDHLVPASLDGTHQIRNLAPACHACNEAKGRKTWQEFFEVLGKGECNNARRALVEKYTEDYLPGQPIVTDPADMEKLDQLLGQILQAMSDADEIIEKALAARRK